MWRRYIYLWINYALYEELEAEDEDRTRQIYRTCLDIIPHKTFTFSKIWLLYAQFEIRHKNLPTARKTLVRKLYYCVELFFFFFMITWKHFSIICNIFDSQGMALGVCPRDKLYRGYIDLEIQLREFDRCRTLYQKFLEHGPENCITWMRVCI